ncbi:MAG: LLM class flavin-dependent oxidoreductase [Acidimicrobiales bacterium]
MSEPERVRSDAAGAGRRRPILSVLDLSPVGAGSTAGDALAASTELARLVERLGYHRLWVAEHHNMPGIASSSPPVLVAHLAASTETIRVGAGGVMLPNHPALVVAEQFGMLEALHPGRIDLGIGRAPGTDAHTAAALRRTEEGLGAEEFPQQLADLFAYFEGRHGHITAVPAPGFGPAIWLLGSSDYSAQVAGRLGLPFSFAHHFASQNTDAALAVYRRAFEPSPERDAPYSSIGVGVVCADDAERARWLAGPSALAFLKLRMGRPSVLPTPEEAAAYGYSDAERAFVEDRISTMVVGDPDQVRAGLEELAARTGVDELMVTTMVHGAEDRLRSYELLAEVWERAPVAESPLA